MRWHRALLILGSLALVVPAGASAKVIKGCVDGDGTLRIAKKCKAGEKKVKLLASPPKAGAQGPPGPQGTAGETGPQGPAGASTQYTAGTGLDLTGDAFSLELPLSLTAPLLSGSVIEATNSSPSGGTGFGITGAAASTADGLSAQSGVSGVMGVVTPTVPGAYSAGVRGINQGTAGTGIGVVGFQGGSGWGVYGETPSGFGVYGVATNNAGNGVGARGETFSTSGLGVEARYSGAGGGVALQIDNGAIEVAGGNRPAIQLVVDAADRCGPASQYSEINSPLINGDPNALLFVTATGKTDGSMILPALGGIYNAASAPIAGCTQNRWHIANAAGAVAIPVGVIVNVLMINRQ